ncbi:MAG TPA: HAMP domain-containing protein, partial [Polyangiales bacterium]|nr:HAMP domain-containing protein [Polyangiales bacterium]
MKKLQSLRGKFVRTVLLVAGFIGIATLGIVVFTSAQASSEHLARVQKYISEGITSKGRVLTENHARALRGLTLDNAFLDMQRLVERAVHEDTDLVYGLYVNSDKDTLALSRRGDAVGSDKTPEKDAWRALQLADAELVVKAPRVRQVTRLGQELVEVAVPVFGEDNELVGTIRYGLSTRRMQDAMSQAKIEAKARLVRSVSLVGSLITVASVLGLLLSRMQATRITRPVANLTVAAQDLAAGNRAVRVDVDSGDEIELLGASFNRMVEELDSSYRELEKMNRTLEHKVEERTLELANKNRDMRLVLDNV